LSSIHSLHIKPTFFSKFYLSPRHPHSFPTRRSSDLPNVLAPRKRPLHTIIPAFMQKDDVRIGFGIMGGFNQAQAHAQFVANIADYGMTIQEALEAGRFTKGTFQGCDVSIEALVPDATLAARRGLGLDIRVV